MPDAVRGRRSDHFELDVGTAVSGKEGAETIQGDDGGFVALMKAK